MLFEFEGKDGPIGVVNAEKPGSEEELEELYRFLVSCLIKSFHEKRS